ncbi:30S ribosomal protein S13 [Nanoarchaeota archaeon]
METQELKHIIRVAKTDLPGDKPIAFAMKKIKGVGLSFANAVCSLAQVDKTKRAGALTEQEVSRLTEIIENPLVQKIPVWMLNRQRDLETNEDQHILLGTLGFVKDNDIKRLKKIKSYRGSRHAQGLPVRGQRTRSNFRKNKGKVTLGVQRKKVGKK